MLPVNVKTVLCCNLRWKRATPGLSRIAFSSWFLVLLVSMHDAENLNDVSSASMLFGQANRWYPSHSNIQKVKQKPRDSNSTFGGVNGRCLLDCWQMTAQLPAYNQKIRHSLKYCHSWYPNIAALSHDLQGKTHYCYHYLLFIETLKGVTCNVKRSSGIHSSIGLLLLVLPAVVYMSW